MLENKFQRDLIRDIENRFPGCVILKNDSGYIQGIPDLSIFFNERWAMLECKKSATEKFRPNQKYYLDKLNKLSYAKVIYPENKEKVLNEMEYILKS